MVSGAIITKPIQDMAVLEHAIEKSLERSRLLQQNEVYKKHLAAVNSRLKESLQQLQDDEEAGRKMQFQLLAESNALIHQCEYSRRLMPSMYLSEDFVDYFQIDDHRAGFYMADVSILSITFRSMIIEPAFTWRMSRFCRLLSDR